MSAMIPNVFNAEKVAAMKQLHDASTEARTVAMLNGLLIQMKKNMADGPLEDTPEECDIWASCSRVYKGAGDKLGATFSRPLSSYMPSMPTPILHPHYRPMHQMGGHNGQSYPAPLPRYVNVVYHPGQPAPYQGCAQMIILPDGRQMIVMPMRPPRTPSAPLRPIQVTTAHNVQPVPVAPVMPRKRKALNELPVGVTKNRRSVRRTRNNNLITDYFKTK